jgi:hypothetical protein
MPTSGHASVFARIREMGLGSMLDAREAFGVAKYGQTLMTHDGRDPFVDQLQEQLDGLVYMVKALMENEDLRAENHRMRVAISRLRVAQAHHLAPSWHALLEEAAPGTGQPIDPLPPVSS